MKMLKKGLCLLLTLCIILGTSGCTHAGDEHQIAERIKKFESSCHSLNITGMVDSFDPSDTLVINVLLDVASEVKKAITEDEKENDELFSPEQVIDAFKKMIKCEDEWVLPEEADALRDVLSSVHIKADEISFPSRREDIAIANCTVKINVGDHTYTTRIEFDMIKSDRDWYIDWI